MRRSTGVLTGRTLRLSAPLYLATLLVALLPGLVGLAGLGMIAGDRPWRTELLGPNWLNLLLEVVGSTVYQGGSLGFSLMLAASLLLLPLAMFVELVVYSFLAGGIVVCLMSGPDESVSYMAACRHWFWASLRLSLLGGVILMAITMITGAVGALAGGFVGQDLAAVVQFVTHAVALGWLELARAAMVAAGRTSVGTGLRMASPALLRPSVLLLWLVLALPSVGLALAALSPPPVTDPMAVTDLLLALGYGQLVAFLSVWSKVVRLAAAAWLASAWKARAVVTE